MFLRRDPRDIRINGYNKTILMLHKANMDLQFIIDPYGCVHYVVNYINKSYRGISKLLRDTLNDMQKGHYTAFDKLRRISKVFLSATEVSAQEAVYVLLSMPLTICSRSCVFINTGEKDKRTKMIKTKVDLLKLESESTDIVSNCILDYYVNRPAELEDITLAEFAAKYQIVKSGTETIEDNQFGDDEEVSAPQISKKLRIDDRRTMKYLCTITERQSFKVIRYRRYQLDREELNYYREKVMLYVKWRDEESDILSKDIRKLFEENIEQIRRVESLFIADNTIDYDDIRGRLENERNTFEEPVEEQETAGEHRIYDLQRPDTIIDQDLPSKKIYQKDNSINTFRIPRSLSDECYYEIIRQLNERQRTYLFGMIIFIQMSVSILNIFLRFNKRIQSW